MESHSPVPGWFWPAAIGALLFELLGCATYLMQALADPATLPPDERAMVAATPPWMVGAYGTAVWIGLAGAIALLLRRRLAVPLLLVSFLAVVVHFAGLLIVPELRSMTPSDSLLGPILLIVISGAIVRLAAQARRRGWLR